MGTRTSPGFTIIETMLFLAVTGLLIIGVLVGTGASLNIQRYRDAVETFKTTIQAQYAELGSVKNSRSSDLTCGANATPVEDVEGKTYRGQTDCLIVGRYVVINEGNINIYTVLAAKKAGVVTDPTKKETDIDKLKNNYNYNVDTAVESRTMEWGTQIAWPRVGAGAKPSATTPRTIGILIMRSPESGGIYTFTHDSPPLARENITNETFAGLIFSGDVLPGQGGRSLCIASDGLAAAGDMALYINAFAAGSSAIEVRSNEVEASLGGTTRC